MTSVLLEARPFRPFKSSEEYLIAMKEDLAEWLQTMYTHLNIHSDNFMDKLETGVVLCEHANAVRHQAFEYIEKKQAKKIMTKSVTGSLAQAQALIKIVDVKYFTTAKAGTFFARDNVSNFIKWCRQSLEIIECLLFETDDLIMRKNEKHVILCLLEVARRGARFGMLAPMLVQMERQIDREIAADQKKLASNNNDNHINHHLNNEDHDDSDSDLDDEEPVLMYGPVQQIVTNDLKSLDEMVRDLVEKCTCPTQFPMIRVSEGKYRIGDTKVLIFVRILRNHVMVRVGGGWDTLSHYLDKHDPCRCRTQHRSTQSARLVNKPGAIDLHGSQIYYDRSPTTITTITHNSSTNNNNNNNNLGPPMNTLNRSRSKSPNITTFDTNRRSISPTTTHLTKLTNNKKSLSPTRNNNNINRQLSPQRKKIITSIQISPINEEQQQHHKSEAILQINNNDTLTDQSDTTSEMSDEGYRSLGIITSDKNKKRSSLHSQNSVEDADEQDNCIDDLNEVGLRRTQFSQRIYDNTIDLSNNNNNQSPKKKPPPSSSSLTSSTSVQQQQQQQQSKVNTWNGRQKCQRPSLTIENFNRNTLTRRSVSSLERRSSSANTSPTKGRLRKELLNAVKQNNDDAQIVQQVQELLKKYGSLNVLNNEENNIDNMMIHNDFNLKRRNSSITFNRNGDERISLRTPRKDSRPDNNLSKIPAPVLHKV